MSDKLVKGRDGIWAREGEGLRMGYMRVSYEFLRDTMFCAKRSSVVDLFPGVELVDCHQDYQDTMFGTVTLTLSGPDFVPVREMELVPWYHFDNAEGLVLVGP